MRCVCKTGFSGIFCEKNDFFRLSNTEILDAINNTLVPTVCKNRQLSIIKEDSLKISRTPYTEKSFYLIQGFDKYNKKYILKIQIFLLCRW